MSIHLIIRHADSIRRVLCVAALVLANVFVPRNAEAGPGACSRVVAWSPPFETAVLVRVDDQMDPENLRATCQLVDVVSGNVNLEASCPKVRIKSDACEIEETSIALGALKQKPGWLGQTGTPVEFRQRKAESGARWLDVKAAGRWTPVFRMERPRGDTTFDVRAVRASDSHWLLFLVEGTPVSHHERAIRVPR